MAVEKRKVVTRNRTEAEEAFSAVCAGKRNENQVSVLFFFVPKSDGGGVGSYDGGCIVGLHCCCVGARPD